MNEKQKYEFISTIGKGGMGAVCKAKHINLDWIVAIKRILPSLKNHEEALARFRVEAKILASLHNSNIVQIYDLDEDKEGPFIVMEYVEGGSVLERIKQKGKYEESTAISLFVQISKALAQAHNKGIFHRDIKPANILLSADETPKIADFGIAKMAGSQLTKFRDKMGSPGYGPPELFEDASSADQTTDIYCLGATLYQMLTGRLPAKEYLELDQVPERFRDIMKKMLSKERSERYDSVESLLRDLEGSACQLNNPIPLPLPMLQGTFVDREEQQAKIKGALLSNENLILIIAPAGFGKTELITKILTDLTNEEGTRTTISHIQGILYLSCARGELLLGTLFAQTGSMLGFGEKFERLYEDKDQSLSIKVRRFFSEVRSAGNILVVLDNFEDLLDPGDNTILDDEVREFLEIAASCKHTVKIIITSRAVPNLAQRLSRYVTVNLEDGVPVDNAVQYLRESGLEDEEDALRDFAKKVHCIPKALDSLVGYVEQNKPERVSVAALLREWGCFEHFDKSEGLLHLIEQQFRLLHDVQKRILVVLEVFSVPVPIKAVQHMMPDIEPVDVERQVKFLFKGHLLRNAPDKQAILYNLHPVIMSFLEGIKSSFCVEPGHEPLVVMHRRAADYYHNIGLPGDIWKESVDVDPVLHELQHLIAAEDYDQAADVFACIARDFFLPRGNYSRVIQDGDMLAEKITDRRRLAVIFRLKGEALSNIGKFDEARCVFHKAIEIAQAENDAGTLCECLAEMSVSYDAGGDIERVLDLNNQALSLSVEAGNTKYQGIALGNLGAAYYKQGAYSKAFSSFQQGYDIASDINDKDSQWRWLGNMGFSCMKLNEREKALAYFQKAFFLCLETGNLKGEMHQRANLGYYYKTLHDYETAVENYEAARILARQLLDSRHEEEWKKHLTSISSAAKTV